MFASSFARSLPIAVSIAAAATALSFGPAAATPVTPGIHGGLIGGVNLAGMDVSGAAETIESFEELADSRTGVVAGAFLEIPAGPTFALRPEVLFTMKGDKEETDDLTTTVEFDYIEVPFLAQLRLPTGPIRPLIYGGPSVSMRLGSKTTIEGTDDLGEVSIEEDLDDQTKSVDFGLVAGAGVQIPFGSGTGLGLEARYDYGLVDVNDANGDVEGFPEGIEIKNRVLSVVATLGLF